MPTVPLCADNLGELSGGLSRAIIDAAINDAVRDLEDRAEFDRKPRKVEIHLTMELMNNGQVVTAVEAFAKVPRRRTADTVHDLRRSKDKQELIFAVNSPDRPDQKTIEDYETRTDGDD